MSKFIEKLNKISESTPPPMGFAARASKPKGPPLLLVASVHKPSQELIEALKACADALLMPVLKVKDEIEKVRQVVGWAGEIPCGLSIEAASEEDMKIAKEAGCDFLVFHTEGTSAALLNEEELGKVVSIEPTIEEGLVRTLDELPVDAVLTTGEKHSSLTIQQLMVYNYLANASGKPLLTPASPEVGKSVLEGLLNGGVMGIVVEVKDSQGCQRLAELQKIIKDLPEREKAQESKGKRNAVLPSHLMQAEVPQLSEEESEPEE